MSGWKPERFELRHLANPRLQSAASDYPPELRAILTRAEGLAALAEIETWPGYCPTPLHELPGLARRLGIDRLWYKDESERFGLGSFKALGGAYAVYRYLAEAVGAERGTLPSAAALIAGEHRDITRDLTVATATDGNHGRSVAWGACSVRDRSSISTPRSAKAVVRPSRPSAPTFGASPATMTSRSAGATPTAVVATRPPGTTSSPS